MYFRVISKINTFVFPHSYWKNTTRLVKFTIMSVFSSFSFMLKKILLYLLRKKCQQITIKDKNIKSLT